MKLIDNWAQAPRMYVVQVLAAIAAVQGGWAMLKTEAPELVAALPPNLVHYVTVGLALSGVVVRLIKQFYAPPEFAPTQPTEDEP